MNKTIIRRLLIVLSIMVSIHAIYGAGVEISNIWTSNIYVSGDGEYGGYLIDVDISPSIYIELINHDTYQHNVKLSIKSDEEKTWNSPIVSLPPNSKKKEVIKAKLKFDEIGLHKIQVSVLDENGKIITSKTASINVISPIDIKNITCEDSYINKSNPYIEVCSSPYFTVTLKNNKYSQTDYLVKTWIAVVSNDYNKDASKNKNDAGVLYYGENNSKMVYVPMHGESTVSFKIPKIVQDDDKIKIQVHTEMVGVHGYSDSPGETILEADNNLNIKCVDNKHHKEYIYPVSLVDYCVMTTLDKNTSDILKRYYRKSDISDEEIENAINHYATYGNIDLLPRAYLKSEPFLAVIKLTLKNRCNHEISCIASVKDSYGIFHNKSIKLSKFETRDVYIPCYVNYSGNKKINLSICSEDTFVYSKTENLNIVPKKIPPVKIKGIEYTYCNTSHTISNNHVEILAGRNYTLNIKLINNYNKTLSGNLEIVDDDFKDGIVNCPSSISFRLRPHAEKTYSIPIIFNTGANGDLKLTVKTNDALKDYTKILHINAYNIGVEFDYKDNLKPKVAVVNKNPVFKYYPVAGCTNTFVAKLTNPLDEDVKCLTWVEATDNHGNVMAKSSKKWIYLSSKEQGGTASLDFKIKFNEGFYGYVMCYAIPINKDGEISNITHPAITDSIKVISPLSVKNMTYNNSKVRADIVSASFDGFPVDINYEYWIELTDKNNSVIYKSNSHSEVLHPGEIKHTTVRLTGFKGNYTLKFYVKIPDFIENNGKFQPMILEKNMNIFIGKRPHTNDSVSETIIQNNSQIFHSKPSTNHNNSQTSQNTTTTSEKGLLENIYLMIKNIITGII